MSYRENPPKCMKDVNADGIMSYFEHKDTTPLELEWFKEIISSPEYRLKKNPITKFNWPRIKSEFAKKFFPEIAPPERTKNDMTTEDRLAAIFGGDINI